MFRATICPVRPLWLETGYSAASKAVSVEWRPLFVPNSGNAIFTDSALNSGNGQQRSHWHARRPGRIRCRDKRGHSDRRHRGTLISPAIARSYQAGAAPPELRRRARYKNFAKIPRDHSRNPNVTPFLGVPPLWLDPRCLQARLQRRDRAASITADGMVTIRGMVTVVRCKRCVE